MTPCNQLAGVMEELILNPVSGAVRGNIVDLNRCPVLRDSHKSNHWDFERWSWRPILGILCVFNMPEWQVMSVGMDIGALLGSGPRWRWSECIIGDRRLCKLKNGINQPK